MSKPTAFPLDESKLPFKIPKDTKPREKIMKLGQMITDRVPAKLRRLTVEDPEYWGLASIVTDEMADVALKMKVRQPMTLPELEKATGKPAKELEPLLYQMSCVGLLEYNWENPRREKQYILPMFVPGSAEFFNMNKQQIADHPEVTAFFERMTFLPLEHITAMVPPGGAGHTAGTGAGGILALVFFQPVGDVFDIQRVVFGLDGFFDRDHVHANACAAWGRYGGLSGGNQQGPLCDL